MINTYICTCGTSIITKRKINIDRLSNVPCSRWDEKKDEIDSIRERVISDLNKIEFPGELNETSAEIKSLIKLEVNKYDSIIFITSDTIDGKLSADLVKWFLVKKEVCPGSSIRIEIIPGLQSYNGFTFQKKGLKNLLNFLINNIEDSEVILNPTGGFKSIVPYISLIGMIFNKPVKYIHEDSNDVITLMNIPILIDEDLILRVEDKMRKIESKTAISKEEWRKGVDFQDKRFDCLVEEIDNQITLSGIGMLFWERFKKDFPEDLERDTRSASEKENGLIEKGKIHHGIRRLKALAEKILHSYFVCEVINTCNFNPYGKEWVNPLTARQAEEHLKRESEGICLITDKKSDEGYSLLIRTTARNYDENKEIATLLNRKYFKS